LSSAVSSRLARSTHQRSATTPPVPPDDAGITAARQAFAWFRSHYAALNLGTASAVPVVGPSQLQQRMLSGVAKVIIVLCAIGGIIALVGMRVL